MRMTPRERYLSALYLEEPDKVPIFDIEVLPELVKKILGDDQKLPSGSMSRPEEYLKLFIRVYSKLGMDAVPAYYVTLDSPEVCTQGDHQVLIQKGFSKYEIPVSLGRPSAKSGAWKIVGQVKTLEDFDRIAENLPNIDPCFQLKIIHEETKGLDMPTCGIVFGGYLTAAVLMGLEEIVKAPYENPKLLKGMIEYLSDWQTEIGLAMIDSGADSIGIGEDFADTHNLFMSPHHFREFILSSLKKQTQTLKRKGVPVILHHCGNYSMVLEDIVNETGGDCLQPLQPEAMNIADVKRRVGDRICLWGNISINTLSHGITEDVVREVRERIGACAPGGGYILGSSHTLLDSVKVENLYAMIKAARKYGRY